MTAEEGSAPQPLDAPGHGPAAVPFAGRAQKLVGGYPGAAVVVDLKGLPTAANAAGQELHDRLAAGEISAIEDLVDRCLAEEMAIFGEVRMPGPETEHIWGISAVPLFDGQAALLLARDLTLERNLRAALAESRQRYKDLVDISSEFAWEVGADGTFAFISPRGAIGYGAKDLIGRRPAEFVRHAEDYAPLPFACREPMERIELWLHGADGHDACMLVSSLPLHSPTGAVVGARGVCRDVTAEREHEAALSRVQHRERLTNYVTAAIRDKIDPLDMLSAAAGATARALGATGCRIFRHTEAEAYATAASFGEIDGTEILGSYLLGHKGEDYAPFELVVGDWLSLAAATHHGAAVNGAVAVWRPADLGGWSDDERQLLSDIAGQLGIANEQISNHERMRVLSRSDGMTGLLNRRAFIEEELPRRMSRLRREEQTAALFYIDMDNFKAVNDVHGHHRGDEALLMLRGIMVEHSRPRDVIARLGGDEFAMWLDGITADVARQRAATLLSAASALAVHSGDRDRPLGISIGIALYDPVAGESIDDLMARADAAMYIAKRQGKGSFGIAPPPGSSPAGTPVSDRR